jgi:hypothetical protein
MPATQVVSIPRAVQPNEAHQLPALPNDSAIDAAVVAMATACNGFAYAGGDLEAQLRAVKFLRTRPDLAQALGIGVSVRPAPQHRSMSHM